jgi:hypothetical protein
METITELQPPEDRREVKVIDYTGWKVKKDDEPPNAPESKKELGIG